MRPSGRLFLSAVLGAALPAATSADPADPKPVAANQINLANDLACRPSLIDKEIGTIASLLEASMYVVSFGGEDGRTVCLGDGLLRLGDHGGEFFRQGDHLSLGVYWNDSGATVWVCSGGDGLSLMEIPASGVFIHTMQRGGGNPVAEPLSITCAEGYYACCCRNSGGSTLTAHCVSNGQNPPADCTSGCTAGGPGTVSCSIGGPSQNGYPIQNTNAPLAP